MSNPHEVDVSKEDIAGRDSGLSDEGKEFFGVKEEESMPATRRSRRGVEPEREEEEVTESVITVVVHTPRHLWGLGATQFHFHNVESTNEAFEIIGEMQENFEWAEKEFAERLATVAALENRITPAQIAKLEELAEERDEDLPDLTHYSKTEASKLIQELMGQTQRKRPTRRSRSTARTKRTGSRRSSNTRSSRSGGSKRRGGFDNDRPGSITSGQVRFLRDLYRQADEDVPDDLDDMTFKKASAEITDLKDALGLD